jgi:hypothetical protein
MYARQYLAIDSINHCLQNKRKYINTMKKFLLTIFLLGINTYITAAESIMPGSDVRSVTHEQKKQWDCSICSQYISIDASTDIKNSLAHLYSIPLKNTFRNALVLVKTEANTWQLGIITDISITGSPLSIHLCNNHTFCTENHNEIRELLPYWQYQWQHRIPLSVIHTSFMHYLGRYSRQSAYPFDNVKVLDDTDKILAIGDLHGSSKSLREILKQWFMQHIIDAHCKLAPTYYAICLGDYADRSNHGG